MWTQFEMGNLTANADLPKLLAAIPAGRCSRKHE